MDTRDRQAIADLFDRLADVERQAPARDAQAEALIAASVARQGAAPYYMAQTIIVQQHALNATQDRIADLEAELAEARASQGGGFLASLFGDAPTPPRPTGHRPAPNRPNLNGPAQNGPTTGRDISARPGMPQGAPGGFLAGATQTAIGVAGGLLLANALGGLFAGPAHADPAADPAADTGPEADDGGLDDGLDW